MECVDYDRKDRELGPCSEGKESGITQIELNNNLPEYINHSGS